MNERELYRSQVALLIRIMPSVYRIKDFAVHGGTAINLFYHNLPRYSVDIDLTYIPIQNREESLTAINTHLQTLKIAIERTVPSVRVIHKQDVWKLMCTLDLSHFPSVQWKLKNITKLKSANPEKHQKGVAVLQNFLKQ